ncbi:adenosylcobinamide-GDP ribazoletransferase [Sphaerotilus sp.]|uniref:adenosylcobinamide-GDP ribazoletransferase n=1 Tax=Sphaerotilus sp. TaxID=2093942 RepID=UPI002ACD8D90|nr:adenosylcobinamide-GDP ribazoletransferase [Sphaerotilus sp.]MDZ7856232.1 adenosylcobinamide-GDP ribazoletransferase [Sphaerotilus sp.]
MRWLMHAVVHEFRLFFIALQFFTRVPVPGWVGWTPEWMHASARHYPAVGLCIGAVGAAVLALGAACWPLPVAVGLSMAATVWMTGGFHEDGLADTCDGLGGTVSRERALTIMKDSRLGSYGALGLVGVLGLKAVALHGLVTVDLLPAMVATVWAHALSRVAPVVLLWVLPYAGDLEHTKAKPMAQQISGRGLLVVLGWAGLVSVAAVAVLGDLRPVLAGLLGLACMVLWCGRWFHGRLGGYTGDTLGASQQLSELAALLGWLAVLHG